MAGMPHTTVPSSIPIVLRTIRSATVPRKVTGQFLEANGLPEGEGIHMVGLLRALGFIDGAGRPTIIWSRYRRPDQSAVVLATAVRSAYAPLFQRFNDAYDQPAEALARVIRRHTEYAEHHIARTAECFLVLCEHSDFTVTVLVPTQQQPSGTIKLTARERLTAMRRLTAAHSEALECLSHELHRPAHVSVWNAFAATALTILAADEFGAVRAVRPSWKGTTVEDLSMHTSGELLLEMLSQLGLVDLAEVDDLGILLQRRDDCAHPTFYTPTSEETVVYVAEVVAAALALIGRALDTQDT
ncbi:hypothetical protein GEV29_13510 [Aeromicrobium sp. SMF47]|nr:MULTISPECIES: DUF5343 domain-containing protein [Aeromicrobium]MRJ77557.1 hypothetical protein [Aeromicrobium yanjiei]MRK01925.1 hypothetical protein [Aeromicrobium sp. S22]